MQGEWRAVFFTGCRFNKRWVKLNLLCEAFYRQQSHRFKSNHLLQLMFGSQRHLLAALEGSSFARRWLCNILLCKNWCYIKIWKEPPLFHIFPAVLCYPFQHALQWHLHTNGGRAAVQGASHAYRGAVVCGVLLKGSSTQLNLESSDQRWTTPHNLR